METGQVTVSHYGNNGNPTIVATWFYNPSPLALPLRILWDKPYTLHTGVAVNAAFIVDNYTNTTITVGAVSLLGLWAWQQNIPPAGYVATAAACLLRLPPLASAYDLNGFTLQTSG